MCGFAGYLVSGRELRPLHQSEAVLRNMGRTIVHRGPDDMGLWIDANVGIGLVHRRLSVIELSPAGHQPMRAHSGRYVVAFNGEIYNHLILRKMLADVGNTIDWRGHSDTETLLAGFDVWGIEETIKRSIGMFAMAIWDCETRELTLARDRLGEKPLYYGWQGAGAKAAFLFGSELKALKAYPEFKGLINRGSLALLLRHSYVPAPYSIYDSIKKLEPGCLLKLSLKQKDPVIVRYWSALQVAAEGVRDPYAGTAAEATDELETLLKDAIRQQMMADVPLGAFLSGGIDSSTVVALMQAQSSRPVKTFTIGFNETGYNEALHAKAVARHLGTDHTEMYVTSQQALDVIPQLPSFYCEPFADSSQIPTYLVSQLARKQVTVSLSGDAGDELFCGYNRYLFSSKVWRSLSMIPTGLRQIAANLITSVSPHRWNALLGVLQRHPHVNWGDKLHKGANVLAASSLENLYRGLVSHWHDPASIVIGGVEPNTLFTGPSPDLPGLDSIQRMMAIDTVTYLPDDILVKLDRAAMAVSLEGRVPFLDHRVVEFAWRLPQAYKMRDGQTKRILRQILYRHVPKSLIERPKMGFGVPIDVWLRGPLKAWGESLLDEGRLRREGYLEAAPILKKWQEHQSGKRNWQYPLWNVLMFQAWLENEHV